MKGNVIGFGELSPKELATAGGKGGSLAKLYQAGYPVPDGFVILPSAFKGENLQPEAWQQVLINLNRFRQLNGKPAFAVRSSALREDSAYASFAGEFETVLDVHTDEAVRAAVYEVFKSRLSERVKAYSRAKGLEGEQRIAIVVQKMVRADISGILFTADPVSGSRGVMNGNFVFGFGEELVSGEVEPYIFAISPLKTMGWSTPYRITVIATSEPARIPSNPIRSISRVMTEASFLFCIPMATRTPNSLFRSEVSINTVPNTPKAITR